MVNYGCKNGLPCDIQPQYETQRQKWEICKLCGKKYKWNKTTQGKIDNKGYLEAHIRDFAQSTGNTKELYHRIYKPITIQI